MSDAKGWGIQQAQPPERFFELKRPAAGPVQVQRKPGGRVVGAGGDADEAAQLRKVAEDFEAVFLYQILKQMRGTIHKEEMFHGGPGEDIFTEMMDEEFSKRMAGNGTTGVAEMLFRQLSRQYGIQEPGEPREAAAQRLPDMSEAAGALRRRLQGVRGETKAVDVRATSRGF